MAVDHVSARARTAARPDVQIPGPAAAARSRLAALLLVAGVLIAAGLGGIQALRHLGVAPMPVGTAHHIGDDVRTSFGIVAVEFVRSVDGVTHRQLAGASHGVSGLVDAEHAQIQVAVAVTNRTDSPLQSSISQFHLVSIAKGRTAVLSPSGGDMPDTRVLPHAGIEGHLDFTVPAGTVQLALQYTDPGRSAPIVIDLGTTTSATTAHASTGASR